MRKTVVQMVLAGGLALLTGCVGSQEMARIENHINALEMENVRLLKQLKKHDGQLGSLAGQLGAGDRMDREKNAEFNSMMEQVREEIRALKGRVETVEFNLGGKVNGGVATADEQKRTDDAVSRNYQRIIAIEAHLGLEPSQTLPEGNAAPSREGASDAKSMYQNAKALLDNGDNPGARKAFEAFIKAYPDSPNADNARFWIADSYYREKWYEKAILEYQTVIEKYAQGNKVPAALLKQGYAFANLGEKGNARLILKELIRKYPASSEAAIAGDKLESLK